MRRSSSTYKMWAVLSLLTVLVLALSGCVQQAAPPAAPAEAPAAEAPAAEAPAAEQPLTIAFSVPDMAFPFFVFMESQVREEAQALGVNIVTLDGQGQVPKQTADMEAAIAQEYDGVLISPLTADAMAPAVQQVVDAGIPVVTVDRTVTGVETLAHVGADNVLGGEQQGLALLELFPEGAVIFELLGTPGSSPAIDRSAGLHNVIDSQPEIEVACQQTADFRRDDALSVTENCLAVTPGVNAIVAANDEMAFGAVEAVSSQGVTDVIVIGYDALPEALLMVQQGELYGTVEQFPGEQARTGLRTLVEYIRNGTAPAEHDIFIQPELITQANLNQAERIAEIGGAPAAPAEEPAAPSGAPATIAFSVPDMAFPFFVFMESQVREEAQSLGVDIVSLDGQGQVPKQTADMEAVIAQEYDGVLISPLTADAMAPAVQQLVDAGIPVVTVDRTVTGVETLAHVGADNVLGGEKQGEALLELFPDGAVIFELLGTPGSSPAIDRSAGLHNVIDSQPEIEVACQQTADFRRDDALSVTENCLAATPDVDAVVAANDEMAFGAVEALKARGLSEVIVIGYDALPEALLMVQQGELYGTVEQFPGEQARTGLRTLVDYVRNGTAPAEHDIFIEPQLITQDNLDRAERIGEIQ